MNELLPDRPDLGQLKKQAKELLEAVHGGEAEALTRMAGENLAPAEMKLHDAQRIIARERGFASWAQLKLHVETRTVDEAENRLVTAVLFGEADVVTSILNERPQLARRSAWTAAAWGDVARVREELERAPEFARTKGGPTQWEPLLLVCFGRCGAGDEDRAAMARALLANGGNPNAQWFHHDWPDAPLTPLYGATGVNEYPQLARVLLEAGADPNDGESRYHAAEHGHVAALEVLGEFGCDFSGLDRRWGNTPLYFLLGYTHAPAPLQAGLRWLLEHGANPNTVSHVNGVAETALHAAVNHHWPAETIRLLVRHGADVDARRADGRTAYALAVRSGNTELAEVLTQCGAATGGVSEVDRFLGACVRGEVAAARKHLANDPGLVTRLSADDARLPLVAAREGKAAALETMAELGLSLDVSGDMGERPVHWASWYGWAEAVRVLLARGVPLSRCDRRFGAPPSGWCAHGSEHCANPKGEYGRVMELLIAAGAEVPPDTNGSAEIMAVLRRHGIGVRKRR